MKAFVLATITSYSVDELDEMTFSQLAEKVALSEKIIEIKQDHIFPYEIEPYKRNEYVKVPWFANMPENVFKTLEKNLGWHMLITAKPQS